MSDDELSEAAERASPSLLGREVEPRTSRSARHRAARGNSRRLGVALVGEAAHVVPPIGAQGLKWIARCRDLADIVGGDGGGRKTRLAQVLTRSDSGTARPMF